MIEISADESGGPAGMEMTPSPGPGFLEQLVRELIEPEPELEL
jgi:hypothetical protein